MEVVSVGIMLLCRPRAMCDLLADRPRDCHLVRREPGRLPARKIPDFTIGSAVEISILAILCALVSILFCVMLHGSDHLYKKFFKNPYLRVFVGGCIVVVLTLLVGDQTYNGTGINIIARCMDGTVRPEAFFLKMLFTAVTLGAGYKGGEIVPSLFTGAAFGCLFGNVLGFSPTLCTAVWHVRGLLRRDKLSDHLAAHQL
ncbi:MAG: chloride channel protein [Roseburia sp.]